MVATAKIAHVHQAPSAATARVRLKPVHKTVAGGAHHKDVLAVNTVFPEAVKCATVSPARLAATATESKHASQIAKGLLTLRLAATVSTVRTALARVVSVHLEPSAALTTTSKHAAQIVCRGKLQRHAQARRLAQTARAKTASVHRAHAAVMARPFKYVTLHV